MAERPNLRRFPVSALEFILVSSGFVAFEALFVFDLFWWLNRR